ncbi:MAG TPA: glycosyltransferase family 1 protein [Pyrinomonadaceae bacterium]|nr:glycosyltransferase family 1 protein [Pyrinomonadaceae bacterium]
MSGYNPTQTAQPDLICFSHLRWDFVYQRPQHLLKRCAATRRVFFVEEPAFDNGSMHLNVRECEGGIKIVVPHLPEGLQSEIATTAVLKDMILRLITEHHISNYLTWYYTPMALDFSRHLKPLGVIYDCMDELSAFKGAPESLVLRERELFKIADLVFTGGQSLYEVKRNLHPSVHAFPSSIDREHFMQARASLPEPADQKHIAQPRLGFFGVIDERFDTNLLDEIARLRPDYQFVMIGPVVKISEDSLPRRSNIHYLGGKKYQELPAYIAGWDVALLLFAQNEATRFISPTKTPEYLAAGKPVVSTPIKDVVFPYGQLGLVRIAGDATEFVEAIDAALAERSRQRDWLSQVDTFLANMSWDETWSRMSQLVDQMVAAKTNRNVLARSARAQTGAAA